MRMIKSRFDDHHKYVFKDKPYILTVSRLETLMDLELIPSSTPRSLKMIKIADSEKADGTLVKK